MTASRKSDVSPRTGVEAAVEVNGTGPGRAHRQGPDQHSDAGIRVRVESAVLKVDPVATTKLDVEPGTPGFTGVPISILSVPDVGVALGVLLVRSADTKADRTRWRVRDEHVGSLGEFSFLSTWRARRTDPSDSLTLANRTSAHRQLSAFVSGACPFADRPIRALID